MTIDEINLPRVDFIKLDIEGMEMEALEGARQTIDRSVPILLIERIKADGAQLTQWLEGRDYQVMQVGNQSRGGSQDRQDARRYRGEVAQARPRNTRKTLTGVKRRPDAIFK